MATTQMNVRLETDLKQSGDKVLSDRGISPSAAVRSLWEYLDRNRDLPEFMTQAESDRAERKRAIACAAGRATRELLDANIIEDASFGEDYLSNEALRELMYGEKAGDHIRRWNTAG